MDQKHYSMHSIKNIRIPYLKVKMRKLVWNTGWKLSHLRVIPVRNSKKHFISYGWIRNWGPGATMLSNFSTVLFMGWGLICRLLLCYLKNVSQVWPMWPNTESNQVWSGTNQKRSRYFIKFYKVIRHSRIKILFIGIWDPVLYFTAKELTNFA